MWTLCFVLYKKYPNPLKLSSNSTTFYQPDNPPKPHEGHHYVPALTPWGYKQHVSKPRIGVGDPCLYPSVLEPRNPCHDRFVTDVSCREMKLTNTHSLHQLFSSAVFKVKGRSQHWFLQKNVLIITNSSVHFTITVSMRFTVIPLSLGQKHSFNLSELPEEYTTGNCSAPKAFSYTIPTLAGTHLYPWVQRSNYGKVSCSRTQLS